MNQDKRISDEPKTEAQQKILDSFPKMVKDPHTWTTADANAGIGYPKEKDPKDSH